MVYRLTGLFIDHDCTIRQSLTEVLVWFQRHREHHSMEAQSITSMAAIRICLHNNLTLFIQKYFKRKVYIYHINGMISVIE